MDARKNKTTFFCQESNKKNGIIHDVKKSKKTINLPIHRIEESDYDVVIEDEINSTPNSPTTQPSRK